MYFLSQRRPGQTSFATVSYKIPCGQQQFFEKEKSRMFKIVIQDEDIGAKALGCLRY